MQSLLEQRQIQKNSNKFKLSFVESKGAIQNQIADSWSAQFTKISPEVRNKY